MNAAPVAGALLDGRYRVGGVIATGGMSTVYRGTDTRLDRPVAIKIMDARLAGDPAFRVRFEREARSAARIDHPAVVDVHDQGVDTSGSDERLFLVMELVTGATLRDVLRARGALGVPAAFAVLEQVLAGLAEAHRLGMVHRDVKPENVLVSETREVKVADFGLAVAAAQAGASHVGTILGTVAYLSPEQVATGAADPRSDVYAAGILLYEMLTGEPPYSGDTAISVAYRHVNCDVPAPSEIAGDVPPELDALVRHATRRDPAARPADAAALLGELRRVADELEVPRVRPPAPPPGVSAEPPPEPPSEPPSAAHPRPRAEPPTVPQPVRVDPARPRPSGTGTRALSRQADDESEPWATSTWSASAWSTGTARGDGSGHRQVRRRGRQVFALVTALVLAVAIVVGTVAWWLGSGRWTAVPQLTGVRQDVAERLLGGADLVPTARLEYADDVPAGVVTTTEPATDTRVLRGSTVTIVVSRALPTVPTVTAGTSAADAETAIRGAGFTPVRNRATEYSDSVPAGAVVRTDPVSGAALRPGATVTLVLSRGPRPTQSSPPTTSSSSSPEQVRVPFVVGKRFDEAREILEELGLKAEEHPSFGGLGRENGRVINQSNGAGSTVYQGSTIELETL